MDYISSSHSRGCVYQALFKPSAFFKGIFLPLALEGCSTREAVIVGSVVAKVSIPMLHAAAALMRLAFVPASDWLPAVSVLMAVLINKKYSLPSKVRSRKHLSRSVLVLRKCCDLLADMYSHKRLLPE